MATRQTRLITKNSITPNQPLSGASALKGEAVVNLSDGILYYSGATGGNFVPSDNDNTFFEVGSNVNQLKIRDKITSYSGVTTGLAGQFLSGTTTGFVLAPISYIAGINTYVTGFTYTPSSNTITLSQNEGQSPLPITISEMSGLTINGNLTVTGNTNLSGLTLYDETVGGSNPLEIINLDYLTSYTQTNDVYVTGGTFSDATNSSNVVYATLSYHGTPLVVGTLNAKDTFVTGGTYSAGTITFANNSGDTFTVTGIDGTDTYVTGFTYSPSTNTFTIYQNQGESPLPATINEVSGLTVNGDLSVTGLGTNRVVYTTNTGQLTTESNFTYDQGTDILGVTNVEASGDVTIQGSLTVFGPSISAFTTNLYVEDPNITLNYNPTGSTDATSVNSGFVIQDGNGIASGDVALNIIRMQNLSGATSLEYPSLTGYSNRGWITQLNDIVIRSTDVVDEGGSNAVTGVRVLAEGDVLDGGSY